MDLNNESSEPLSVDEPSLIFKLSVWTLVAFIAGAPVLTMFKILVIDKFILPHLSLWFPLVS